VIPTPSSEARGGMIRNASTHSHLHPPQSSLAPDQTAPIAFPIAPPATRRSVSPDNLISHPPFIITLRREISRRPGRVPSPLRRPNRRLAHRTGLHPEPAPQLRPRSVPQSPRSDPSPRSLTHSLTARPLAAPTSIRANTQRARRHLLQRPCLCRGCRDRRPRHPTSQLLRCGNH